MPNLKEITEAGVSGDEMVARAIFSPSFFTRDGKIGPQAYFLTPYRGGIEKDISVLRELMCTDIIEAVKKITPRNDMDKVCGYAELNVAEIRKLSYQRQSDDVTVDVVASPSRHMICHAGIIIKNHGKYFTSEDNNARQLSPVLMDVMIKLARMSSYIPFPEEEGC